MKRKQKRFEKQFDVQAEIIKQKRKTEKVLQEAEAIEDEARKQFKTAGPDKLSSGEREFYLENGRGLMAKARKLRKRAFMIENKKLPSLKNALAEIGTKPLPGILGKDEGVVLHE